MEAHMGNSSNDPRRSARYAEIILYEDPSGWQKFSYGKLGELTVNIRTFALPFENRTYTFKMKYEYDSWNRIQRMTYPDGEVVHYDYNLGGMLEKVYGGVTIDNIAAVDPDPLRNGGMTPTDDPVFTYTYPYIDSIAYNEFELKSEVFHGNGTHTLYFYDNIQRLQALQSQTRAGAAMQDITYNYDAVSNITGIVNIAGTLTNGLGGTYSHHYDYDDLYRLVNSHGQWDNTMKNEHLKDTVRMAYHKNGRIASKKSYANIYSEGGYGTSHATQNSRRAYNYNIQQPNTLSNVYDSVTNTSQNFSWDNSGNMVAHNGRSHSWTEDNRLLTVTDNEWFSYYQYDAGGDRTYKLPYLKTYSNHSGRRSVYWAPEHSTLYASPYLVVTPQGYTKHYYAESERVTSQIGRGRFPDLATPVTDTATANRKVRRADSLVMALNPAITDTAAQLAYLAALTERQNDTCEAYWYHADHLGSSSWITDSAGTAVQHLHYLPWGEDFVNQRITDFSARYTFSAKEKDVETGLSYFGSRYYSSDLCIWLSVDPMSDKYPSLSPYVYCANNPVKLVDPNGEEWVIDGIRYIPGQNCPDDVSESTRDKWNTMNEIYKTKNGKTVIDALNGDDCHYNVSSDTKTNGKGGFSQKDKTLYLNGNDKSVGTLAHEMFHAYQDYNSRSEASIFNEVEANLFSFSVLSQQCNAAVNCIMPPENSLLLNGRPSDNSSIKYQQYYGDAVFLLIGNFDRDKFNNVVSGFLQYSRQNANGEYSNGYKKGCDIYENTLIEKFLK